MTSFPFITEIYIAPLQGYYSEALDYRPTSQWIIGSFECWVDGSAWRGSISIIFRILFQCFSPGGRLVHGAIERPQSNGMKLYCDLLLHLLVTRQHNSEVFHVKLDMCHNVGRAFSVIGTIAYS